MMSIVVKMHASGLLLQHGTRKLASANEGATAIEYGLIAAGIAIAIIAAVFAIGDELTTFFTGIQTQLNSKQPG